MIPSSEEPAMLRRVLSLAAFVYVSISIPAHAQAQQEAAGAVRGRIVGSVLPVELLPREVPNCGKHLLRRVPSGMENTS